MRDYWNTNVAESSEFQKNFNGFYRIRQRNKDWYFYYYHMLEDFKIKNQSFAELLQEFKDRTGRIEPSFISKMYATKNPEYPIIDTWILHNLKIKRPYAYDNNRLQKFIDIHKRIVNWYNNLFSTGEGNNYIRQFDEIYQNCDITKIKKIDFILWQMR